MKRSILTILAISAGLIFAMDASAFGDFNDDQSQYQEQLSINNNYASGYSDGSSASSDNNVTFNESDRVEYDGTYRVKNTPNLGSVNLTSSGASFNNGTCNGSAGIQATIAGTGIAGSTTTVDKPCNLRYLAALAANLGTKADGLRVACLEPDMKKANPTLCNSVYDASKIKTTAGTNIDFTYRPSKQIAANGNGFF